MATALDVANFFIDIFSDSDDPLTHLSIEKLIYKAQGFCLAKLDRPLFNEEIEAWKLGPVTPCVYFALNGYGNKQIVDSVGPYSSECFSQDEIDILLDVVRDYGKFSGSGLVSITHRKGSPWEQVYEEDRNNIIPKSLMKDYYSKHGGKMFDIKSTLNELVPIGPRDQKGRTIFPSDLDD